MHRAGMTSEDVGGSLEQKPDTFFGDETEVSIMGNLLISEGSSQTDKLLLFFFLSFVDSECSNVEKCGTAHN